MIFNYSNLIYDYSKWFLIYVYIKIKRILFWFKNIFVIFLILIIEMVDSKNKLVSFLFIVIYVRFVNFIEVYGCENCVIDCLCIGNMYLL